MAKTLHCLSTGPGSCSHSAYIYQPAHEGWWSFLLQIKGCALKKLVLHTTGKMFTLSHYLLTETESSPAVDSSEGHKVILLAINLTTKNLFGEQILMNPKPRGIDSSISHTKSFVLLMTQSPNSIIYLCSSCVHYCVLHPKFHSEWYQGMLKMMEWIRVYSTYIVWNLRDTCDLAVLNIIGPNGRQKRR